MKLRSCTKIHSEDEIPNTSHGDNFDHEQRMCGDTSTTSTIDTSSEQFVQLTDASNLSIQDNPVLQTSYSADHDFEAFYRSDASASNQLEPGKNRMIVVQLL